MKTNKRIQLLVMISILLVMGSDLQFHSDTLDDGVIRYYQKQNNSKSLFFSKLADMLNMLLDIDKKLPFEKSYAFLVGVSKYTNGISPNLPSVNNDIESMKDFLLNQGQFEEVFVAKDQIVTRELVEKYMKWYFGEKTKKNDRLLFYFSGHGDAPKGDANTGYMQFSKAVPNKFFGQNTLPINDVYDWSAEINVKHCIYIFDCCMSGKALIKKASGTFDCHSELTSTLSGNGSRVILTAGTGDQKAYALNVRENEGNGLFTKAFLNVFKNKADFGKCGIFTSESVFSGLSMEIASLSSKYNFEMCPDIKRIERNKYSGSFVFLTHINDKITMDEEHINAVGLVSKKGDEIKNEYIIESTIAGTLFIDSIEVEPVEVKQQISIYLTPGIHKLSVINHYDTAFTIVKVKNEINKRPLFRHLTPKIIKQFLISDLDRPDTIETLSDMLDSIKIYKEFNEENNAVVLSTAQKFLIKDEIGKAKALYEEYLNHKNTKADERIIEALFMLGTCKLKEGDTVNAAKIFEKSAYTYNTLTENGAKLDPFYMVESLLKSAEIRKWNLLSRWNKLSAKNEEYQLKSDISNLISFNKEILKFNTPREIEIYFGLAKLYKLLAHCYLKKKITKKDPIQIAVEKKDIYNTSSLMLMIASDYYNGVIDYSDTLSNFYDYLYSYQRSLIDSSEFNIGKCIYTANLYKEKAYFVMLSAPIPDVILSQPLYKYGYYRQLHETMEPIAKQVRDNYLNSYKNLNKILPDNKEALSCLDGFLRMSSYLPELYQKLVGEINLDIDNLPSKIKGDERVDLIFNLEDMMLEFQDKAYFEYEDALDLLRRNNLTDNEWYRKMRKRIKELEDS